jgi:NAD(P)-dependent dehydrogenase (short-subunit alcohol dehydrogenase family)
VTLRLDGAVALVSGATRGGGRGIACALGEAGATVYCTGRSTRAGRSEMDRPETVEETADLVTRLGGEGVAVQCDHTDQAEVAAVAARLVAERAGRLDLLVNNIWGGDPLTEWGKPFWEHSLEKGLRMQQLAVTTHLITSWHLVPLMVQRRRGLVLEVTDSVMPEYRGSLYYDLAKASAIRLALAQAEDLRPHGVAALAITPGFLRSEAVLDHFGVTEANWRDAIPKDRHFAASETPAYLGRAVVALAADPGILGRSGEAVATWHLAREYGFTDADGSQPDWGTYFRGLLGAH